jgi:hypothetical protein
MLMHACDLEAVLELSEPGFGRFDAAEPTDAWGPSSLECTPEQRDTASITHVAIETRIPGACTRDHHAGPAFAT